MKKLLLALLAAAFIASCSNSGSKPEKAGGGPKGEAQVQKEAGEAGGAYLAKINEATIDVSDMKREFAMLPEQIQQMYKDADGMESLLDELVKKEILYQEAVKRGYEKQEHFAEQVHEFNKRLMIEYLLRDEVEKKALVSDKAVRDFYDENRDKFVRGDPTGKKSEVIEFEQVKELIKERLVAEEQKAVFDDYVASLKEKAKVEINEGALKAAFGNAPAK